jgi:hypothetical protein
VTITETSLRDWSLCSMLRRKAEEADASFETGTRLLQLMLLERFNGHLVPLANMREKFTHMLKRDFYRDVETSNSTSSSFWMNIRTGISVARRIFSFILDHEVIRPITPYELNFAGHRIVGKYALVRRNTGKQPPMVLMAPHSQQRKAFDKPDPMALSRYLHATMQAGDEPIGIYSLPIIWGKPWKRKDIREPLVHAWLSNILNGVNANTVYPSPGFHCDTCRRPCLEVFQ